MNANNKSTSFLKTDSEMYREQLWNNMSKQKSINRNMFVDMADLSDYTPPSITLPNRVLTRSESKMRLGQAPPVFGMQKDDSLMSFMNFQMAPETPTLREKSVKAKKIEKIEGNHHDTMEEIMPKSEIMQKKKSIKEIKEEPKEESKEETKEEAKSPPSKASGSDLEEAKHQKPTKEKKKKKKRRRDVIFKTILRECRRYFQVQISDLTGFISSK